MQKPNKNLIRVSPDDLDVLLDRAQSEGWTELALLGHDAYIRNPAEHWPKELKRYKRVHQLTGSVNDLGARLGNLTNVTSLNLSDNELGEAEAKHLAALTNLTSLDLSRNELGDAGAKHLATLTNLTSLNLSRNELGDAGAKHLATLTNLTSLDLSGNKLGDAGAKHLAALTNLTSLDLSGNKLGDAGAKHLAALTNLTSLNLYGNELGEAGAKHLAALTNLTSLDLSRNELGDGGVEHLVGLNNLTSLDLYDNGLGEAGAKHLAALTNLTSLRLWENKVGDLGAKHLSSLGSLTHLNLGDNEIREVGARHIAKLTNLTELYLWGNTVGDLGAKYLAALTNLSFLSLRDCGVSDAGLKYLRALDKLDTLALHENPLTDVSDLAVLPKIRNINIARTQVSNLTPLAELIEKGRIVTWSESVESGIAVKDCPLTHPPPEVVEAGHEAVLSYFREAKAQGVDKLYEAKLLLVGEGRSGKTSLLRRLYAPEKTLPGEEETTKGIDIHLHEFPIGEGRHFRLNVWDFGGQEIYHATHQFFLTKRSLYVLLDDTAKDHTTVRDTGFKYWLEVVELLSEGSPVLIFQNEKGGRSKTIDIAGIRGRFPNVKDVYRGDLRHLDAAGDIREAIKFCVQQLPHIGDHVPAKWVAIRAEIEERARGEPYISEEAYFEIYGRHLEFDREKARHLSQYLHDLGVFLHFQDQPLLRRTVVLQNEWVTEAVFRILDHERTKKAKGRFTSKHCAQIWSDPTYADMHAELLAMMERFELCYRLPDTKPPTWLAPQLLPPSIPEAMADWDRPGDLVLSYRYDFLPKGLISRLMVRMHRYVKQPELGWTGGALFVGEDTQVLVRTDPQGDEVVLRARGLERKALLSVIAGDLDALNESFGGLDKKVEKRVPCICSLCRNSSKPVLYDERRLLKRKQANRRTVECDESYEDVDVLALLDGLPSQPKGKRDRLRPGEDGGISIVEEPLPVPSVAPRTIKIFLASSEELAQDRNAFDLYFRQQNDWLREDGYYLEIVRWEKFVDAMSETRLQDEYNEAVRRSDIFVSLFSTKAGKFTEEEFDVAYRTFTKTNKRLRVYTFFKNTEIKTGEMDREALQSLWAFQDKLRKLEHFHTKYDDIEHLKRQFSDQLQELIRNDMF